jgi:hypothetical protein
MRLHRTAADAGLAVLLAVAARAVDFHDVLVGETSRDF